MEKIPVAEDDESIYRKLCVLPQADRYRSKGHGKDFSGGR